MAAAAAPGRRAILDIAPLELECLRALWPLGQATVRQVQQGMASRRPRAYTTVMTILDRLAQKGIVAREKRGRAWLYRPLLSEAEARAGAVGQVVEHFFDGSPGALAAHLAGASAGARDARRAAGAESAHPAPRSAPSGEAANLAAAARGEEPRRAADPRGDAGAVSAAEKPAPSETSSVASASLDPTLL